MKKALIADDTKNIRTLLTTCLEINGYSVMTAVNGEQALSLILQNDFDIAFIDIKMPEISGTEVLRRIRDRGIDLPVVIMTAFATVKNAVECTKLGAVFYLQKPFTSEKINDVVSMFENISIKQTDLDTCLKNSKELLGENCLDDALRLLKKALSINPSFGEIYFLIGSVYEKKGDSEEALKFYRTAENFNFISK
jgi:DNA-binding NtrC family response regulator